MWQIYWFRLFTFLSVCLCPPIVSAQEMYRAVGNPVPSSSIRFIKNEGQFDKRAAYKLDLQQGALFLENNAFTYTFHEVLPDLHAGEKPWEEGKAIKKHAFQLVFRGAGDGVEIYPSRKHKTYLNYFLGNDPSKWRSKVPLYGQLLYKDLYGGIDMQVLGQGDALKYEFMVQPGKDPDLIQMQYRGVDSLFLQDGNLHVQTSLVEVVELAPFAYQMINGKQVVVPSRFVLEGNNLSFEFPESYDSTHLLVIDPTLIFSTYTGSFADNWGYTATYDQLGNAYAGGIHYGDFDLVGYPVTLGALQTFSRGGDSDMTISKFSPTGNSLIYSTYIGGRQEEYPASLVVNDQQELFLLGRSNSQDFPVTTGAYQSFWNADPSREAFDLVVMHFSADGTQILGSTYLGGTGEDGVNGEAEFHVYTDTKYNYGDESRGEIILAPNGDCILTSSSRSTNFPVSTAAAQRNNRGGQDIVVARLTEDMTTLVASTYVGGNGDDAGYGIKQKSDGSYVVAGGSASSNYPQTGGAWQASANGGTDGVVSLLTPTMRNIIRSSYVGSSRYDQTYFVELDANENVYVAGQTTGSMPVQTASNPGGAPTIYSNAGAKQFILKLAPDLSDLVYATTVGATGKSTPDIVPTAFLVDQCENVYLSGWGGETNSGPTEPGGNTFGLPVTSDAFQSNTDGSDFYLMVLSRDAEFLTYGSYFGGSNSGDNGEHVDGGTSRFDASGQIYQAVCAGCGGESTFPSTPSAFSRTNNSSNCNMAVFKMQFDLSGVVASFLPLDENLQIIPDNAGCAPLTINFDNNSTEKSSLSQWLWDFDDNGNTSTDRSPQYTFTQPGIYDVMLVISDPSSCNESDTVIRQIEVYPTPMVNAGNDTTICVGDAVTLNGSGIGTPLWTSLGTLSDPNILTPVANPTSDTDYILRITDASGCMDEDTVRISLDSQLSVDVGNDTLVCENTSLTLQASASGAALYEWTPVSQVLNSAVLSPQTMPISTPTTFRLTAISSLGCRVTDSIFVDVFTVELDMDTFVCRNDSVQLLPQGMATSWQWSPAAGLSDPTSRNPMASPAVSTTYQLIAADASGCQTTQNVLVEVRDLPVINAGMDEQICGGGMVTLTATGADTYSWTPTTGLGSPSSAQTEASPTITTTYTVEGTDMNGCSATDEVIVAVAPLPVITAGADVQICEGDTIGLMASGGVSYSWSPASLLSSSSVENPDAFPSTTTDFEVTGRNVFGCVDMDTVRVEVTPTPLIGLLGQNSICTGQSATLIATGANDYTWNTGETTSSIDVMPVSAATYWVTGETQGCVGDTAFFTVNVFNDFPVAGFTANPTTGFLPLAVQFVDNSISADRLQWNFGDGGTSQEPSPQHTYTQKGDYEVIMVAYSPNNCPDTARMSIEVLGPAVFVPTAFSPNGDGNNDKFSMTVWGFEVFSIRIYSRWGQEVFSADTKKFEWDGTFNGEALPEGAYVFVIDGQHSGGQPYNKGGTITIIR